MNLAALMIDYNNRTDRVTHSPTHSHLSVDALEAYIGEIDKFIRGVHGNYLDGLCDYTYVFMAERWNVSATRLWESLTEWSVTAEDWQLQRNRLKVEYGRTEERLEMLTALRVELQEAIDSHE